MWFHFWFSAALTSITTFGLGLFVLSKDRKKKVNRVFCLYTFAISFWSFYLTLHATTHNEKWSFICAKLMHIGAILIPALFVHFQAHFLNNYDRERRKILVCYLLAALIEGLNTTNLFIPSVSPQMVFPYFMEPGPAYPIFIGYFFVCTTYSLRKFFQAYKHSAGVRHNQMKYLLWGSLFGYLGGSANFFPVYDIQCFPYPLGSYAIAIYTLITTYAIVRHHLMDITVAITRTSVFMAVYILLLGLPLIGALAWQPQLERLLGHRWWVWLWIAGVVLATAAHYVNLYFQQRAEARLLREQRRYQASLLQASHGMTQIRELRRLLNLIVHVITKTVGLMHAAIFLDDPKEEALVMRASRYQRRPTVPHRVLREGPLARLLKETRQPIVVDELKAQLGETPAQGTDEQAQLRAQALVRMQELQASVVVPSFMQDQLIGFLVLGEKRSGKLFTSEDLSVFATLANQAAVAIENARFYEGEKQRQAALFHAASLASLGTMASSMGHQVNNRFNVVSVVASTQKLKLKQLLKKSEANDPETLRKALADCLAQFDSLQEEAMKGGQIVSAIRKIARPSADGHKPVALKTAVQTALDVLQYKIHLEDLDLQIELPADLPNVLGDLSQLGECFLNLIDNGYDAIKIREQRFKPERYRGWIRVTAKTQTDSAGQWVVVQVSDNGVGMTEKEQESVFVPFFTTKATAEKGTGLGLYVIKKILEAHQGMITIASTYAVGTTFTIKLPVAKDA